MVFAPLSVTATEWRLYRNKAILDRNVTDTEHHERHPWHCTPRGGVIAGDHSDDYDWRVRRHDAAAQHTRTRQLTASPVSSPTPSCYTSYYCVLVGKRRERCQQQHGRIVAASSGCWTHPCVAVTGMATTQAQSPQLLHPDILQQAHFGSARYSYSATDVILYALGIGCPAQELRYLYEGHALFAALPTFAVLPAFPTLARIPLHAYIPNFDVVRCCLTRYCTKTHALRAVLRLCAFR